MSDEILVMKQMPFHSHTAVDSRVRVGLLPPATRFPNGQRGWLKSIGHFCVTLEDKARYHIIAERLNDREQMSLELVARVAQKIQEGTL